jgi:hypothetical protein
MRTEREKGFCMLEFHSTKSVTFVQQEFRREVESNSQAAISIRKWYEIFVNTSCICKGKSLARPDPGVGAIDRVRHAYLLCPRKSTRQASREVNSRGKFFTNAFRSALTYCKCCNTQHQTIGRHILNSAAYDGSYYSSWNIPIKTQSLWEGRQTHP